MKSYLGRMVPGPGSSGPGTKTKRLLLAQNEKIQLRTVQGGNPCDNFTQAYPLWMLGWAHMTSARAFKDSSEGKKLLFCVSCIQHRFQICSEITTFERFNLCISIRGRWEVTTKDKTSWRHGGITWKKKAGGGLITCASLSAASEDTKTHLRT